MEAGAEVAVWATKEMSEEITALYISKGFVLP